ncbi:MAG: thioredoxin domain-containing protein [Planctomycetaceae bacterium]
MTEGTQFMDGYGIRARANGSLRKQPASAAVTACFHNGRGNKLTRAAGNIAVRWRACLFLAISLTCGCSHDDNLAFSDETPAPARTSPTVGSPSRTAAAKHPANRLARETSPYLLLHAHNPVDWYPWGPEALEAAKRDNKPIFLSIGYSSCFWCHVMEREVFENEEIAKYMNEHFICIKVDREERPDLDDIYMMALQVYFQAAGSNQGGGWPLSMFLTPEGLPIAGGTYFPPKDLPGRPGFLTVMNTIHKVWTTQEQDIRKAGAVLAAEVQRLMRPALALQPTPLSRELVDAAVQACLQQFDSEYGGLDFNPQSPGNPKFPVPSRLMLLQSQAGRKNTLPEAIAALDKTLQAMAAGGIYDHLGGGFHRYSTDRFWRVPHFEKMLYDNAQLVNVYAHAYLRTNRHSYRDTVDETIGFIEHELTDPVGGFFSALDAETDGVEGAHYVWSKDEVQKLLAPEDATLFQFTYGMEQPEFFEHGYVLHLPRTIEQTAEQRHLPLPQVRASLQAGRHKLLIARNTRPALLKDDKVLTGWNGLMITGLAESGRILQRPKYTAAAEKCAVFIASQLRNPNGRLLRSWRQGEAKIEAYLDDYAYLIEGLLSLHSATQDEKWLHAARRLMDDQVDLFWDQQDKGFYFTSRRHEQLLARTKDAYDSVLPSGNSVSVRNLVRLAVLTDDVRYKDYATDTLQLFAPVLARSPGSLPYMALALQDYLDAFGTPPASNTPAPANSTPAAMPNQSLAGSPETVAPASAPQLQPFAVQAEDLTGKHKAHATLYLAADKLIPGGSTPMAVVITIDKGWHLNANPPRPDFVVPTELTLTSSLGTQLEKVHYPDGHDFAVEGIDEQLLVYEDRVVLIGQLAVPKQAAGKADELNFLLRYQACNNRTCSQPLKVTLTGKAQVTAEGEAPRAINGSIFKPAQP